MKKLKWSFLFCTIVLLIIGFSCQQYESDSIHEKVTEPVELEEYILSGLVFQHSLSQFKEEINKIDMLSLKPTIDSRGNVVMIIPTKISIENKSKVFNQKKKALLEKYPELKKLRSEKRQDVIKERTDNSLKITKALMELEYINDQPRVRSNPSEFFFTTFSDEEGAYAYLDQQIASSSYVEIVLIVFEDGQVMTYTTSDNDATTSFYPPLTQLTDEKWYSIFNSTSPVSYIAHTHRYSSEPSQEDIDNRYDGLDERIYTSGGNTNQY